MTPFLEPRKAQIRKSQAKQRGAFNAQPAKGRKKSNEEPSLKMESQPQKPKAQKKKEKNTKPLTRMKTTPNFQEQKHPPKPKPHNEEPGGKAGAAKVAAISEVLT